MCVCERVCGTSPDLLGPGGGAPKWDTHAAPRSHRHRRIPALANHLAPFAQLSDPAVQSLARKAGVGLSEPMSIRRNHPEALTHSSWGWGRPPPPAAWGQPSHPRHRESRPWPCAALLDASPTRHPLQKQCICAQGMISSSYRQRRGPWDREWPKSTDHCRQHAPSSALARTTRRLRPRMFTGAATRERWAPATHVRC